MTSERNPAPHQKSVEQIVATQWETKSRVILMWLEENV
jgi:hypothetical protein